MHCLEIACRHFVRVAEVSCTHHELKGGDILLRLGDKRITRVSDLYGLALDCLELSVVRAGTEIHLQVPTVTTASYLVDRVVWFCGAQLETPYSPVHYGARELYSDIWVSSTLFAGPAGISRLPPLHFVTRINDKLTEDGESLLRVIAMLPNDRYCQITCASRESIPTTVHNMRDFKTTQIRKEMGCQNWQYREL
jgi:hypothetical protein